MKQDYTQLGIPTPRPTVGLNGRMLNETFQCGMGFFGREGTLLLLSEMSLLLCLTGTIDSSKINAHVHDLGDVFVKSFRGDEHGRFFSLQQSLRLAQRVAPHRMNDVGALFARAGISMIEVGFAIIDMTPQAAPSLPRPIGSRVVDRFGVPMGPGVYFIQAGPDGPIKIGKARRCIARRIDSIRTASPTEILFLAAMPSHEDEIELHRRFASARVRGEWFHPTPELMAFIQRLLDGFH